MAKTSGMEKSNPRRLYEHIFSNSLQVDAGPVKRNSKFILIVPNERSISISISFPEGATHKLSVSCVYNTNL